MSDPVGKPPPGRLRFSEFSRRVAAAIGIGFLFAAIALFLWYAVDVLLLMFAGVLLAILLRTLSDALQKVVPISSGWSLAVVCVLIVALAVLLTWLAAPHFSRQFTALSEQLPRAVDQFKGRIERTSWGRWLLAREVPKDLAIPHRQDLIRRTTGIVSSTIGALISVVIVIFVGIYVAAEHQLYERGVIRLVPIPERPRMRQVLQRAGNSLRWWLLARLLAMSIVGLLTWAGLWWLGIPLAPSLAALAALLDVIPNFGPLLAAAPAVLLGLVSGPSTALYVAIVYVVVQSIESYLVTPLVEREVVQLPPALTLLWQVLMGLLAGFLGILLATPLLLVLTVGVEMLYVEDALGDKPGAAPG